MAIIEYRNDINEHPTGWQGFRVSVLGASRKYRQKYFRTTDWTTKKLFSAREINRIREQAIRLHNDWMIEEQFIRDQHHTHFSCEFIVNKPTTVPNPTIRLQMFKSAQMSRDNVSTTVNGNRKSFHQTWDELLDKFIARCDPTQCKIKQMQSNKPTFDQMDKKRIVFNRTSDYKFRKNQLRLCFEEPL